LAYAGFIFYELKWRKDRRREHADKEEMKSATDR